MFIAVSVFGAQQKKKNHLKPPTPPKVKFPTPWSQKVVNCPRFAPGRVLKFRFDRRIMSQVLLARRLVFYLSLLLNLNSVCWDKIVLRIIGFMLCSNSESLYIILAKNSSQKRRKVSCDSSKVTLFTMMCDFWDTGSTWGPSLVPVLSCAIFGSLSAISVPLTNMEKIILFSFTCLLLTLLHVLS